MRETRVTWFVAVSLVAFIGACASSGSTTGGDASTMKTPPDAGSHTKDGGSPDGRTRDAGRDVTSNDSSIDTGHVDSGAPPPQNDAGDHRDAGTDAAGPVGALVPAAACTGTTSNVYGPPPANLPPITDALRGDIVACTSDGTLQTSDVQTQLTAQGDTDVTAVDGVAIYRVQYRTSRANGADGYSSARIYLPLVPISANPPVIVAAHGTEGLATSCTTSMDSTSMRDLALPWASLGYPVIAPDYAGLGTPGTQGYTDNHDTARSVVDSVAALRKFVATTLSQKVVIDGHSQGGGAALATQSLATGMGLQGTLVGVLAFAPEYFSHMDSLGYIDELKAAVATNPLTITTGVTKCEVAALIEYAYFANYVPADQPTAGFPANNGSNIGSSIESLCTVPLGGAIQAEAVHVADWTDGSLRGQLLACIEGGDAGVSFGDGGIATCTGPGQAFYEYLKQNLVPPDALGAPVLLVQGLQDIVMPPDQEAACNVIALEAGGLTPQVCTDATASHTTVVQRNIAFGIQWAQAILAGTTPPPCAVSNLPACDQP